MVSLQNQEREKRKERRVGGGREGWRREGGKEGGERIQGVKKNSSFKIPVL